MNQNTKKEVKSWAKSIVIALGIAAAVRTFLFAALYCRRSFNGADVT